MQRMSGAEPALFGKLPARGDFLRAGPTDEAGRFLETWLTSVVEQSRGELAREPVRFLLAHGQEVLLGCWVASRDEIGRRFPFAYFGRVARDVAEVGWSLLLSLHDVFLGQVESLLQRACAERGGTTLEEVLAALTGLSSPHPSELVRAAFDAQAALSAESVASFEQRVFGATARQPMAYALLTLREAARRGEADLTLDLPAPSAFDLFVWLELADSFAGAGRFPSLVWCPQQTRALVAAGPPSPLAMAFLLDRQHASSSRWPVWTDRPAGGLALAELTPAVQTALASQVSLAELLSALRGGAP